MSAGWFIAGAVLAGNKRETKRQIKRRVKTEQKTLAKLERKATEKEARREAREARKVGWVAPAGQTPLPADWSAPAAPTPNGLTLMGDEFSRLTMFVSAKLSEERKLRTAAKALRTAGTEAGWKTDPVESDRFRFWNGEEFTFVSLTRPA